MNNDNEYFTVMLGQDTTIPDGTFVGTYEGYVLSFAAQGTSYEIPAPVGIRGRTTVSVLILEHVLRAVEVEAPVTPAIAAFIRGAAPGATSAQWSTLYAELEALIDGLGQGIEAALHLMRRQTSDIAHRRNMDARTVESFVSVMLNGIRTR